MNIFSLDELLLASQAGAVLKYLFFWGHTPRQSGVVDKSCLSQWYPAPFELEGVRYTSAEHYMMAEKARLFGDSAALVAILAARTPAEAKTLGRKVHGFDEVAWERQRFAIVSRGSWAKFDQHPELKAFLLASAGRVLVEASPHDRVWGVGLAQDDPRIQEPAQWRGLNLLGFALMAARAALG